MSSVSLKAKLPLMKLIRAQLFNEQGGSVDVSLFLGRYQFHDHSGTTSIGTAAITVKIENGRCILGFSKRDGDAGRLSVAKPDPPAGGNGNGPPPLEVSADGVPMGKLAYYCDDGGSVEVGVDWQFTTYGGVSASFNDLRGRYMAITQGITCNMNDFPEFAPPASFMSHFEGTPFEDDNFTNFHVKAEDRTFHTHRSVLERTMSAFDAMSAHPFVENETGNYVIGDFSAEAVAAFLYVLYDSASICDYILGDTRVLMDIYKLADKYQAKRVFELCTKVLPYAKIDENSICDVLIFAKDRRLDGLYKQCVIAANYIPKAFWKSEAFQSFITNHVEIFSGFWTDVAFA